MYIKFRHRGKVIRRKVLGKQRVLVTKRGKKPSYKFNYLVSVEGHRKIVPQEAVVK